jgi:hypothetical protein
LADRRDGEPLTDEERRWFRSIIQRIAALLALSPQLDSLYQETSANYFTTVELGISAESARERRDARKKKVGSTKVTPAMKPKAKTPKKRRLNRNWQRPVHKLIPPKCVRVVEAPAIRLREVYPMTEGAPRP